MPYGKLRAGTIILVFLVTVGSGYHNSVLGTDTEYSWDAYNLFGYPAVFLVNNSAPYTPYKPTGPDQGDVGDSYSFESMTSDPDNDSVFYRFDWGDDNISEWMGPYPSGDPFSQVHIWEVRGNYVIQVQAKDIHGYESNWSDPTAIEIRGPYLSLEAIRDGLGLQIALSNLGEMQATNVVLQLSISGGFTTRLGKTVHEFSLIDINQSMVVNLLPRGIGLGIFMDLPELHIMVWGDHLKHRVKIFVFRNLGPFVSIVGEYWNVDEAFQGYTLYSPMISLDTFLINNSGDIVHKWDGRYKPALSVYLLENGHILRTAFPGFNPRFWGGGIGGKVEEYDWNNSLVWEFGYSNDKHCLHHDIEPLPNGNILMIAWEYKSSVEAIAAGRNPNTLPMGELWPDHIIEVKPMGTSGGEIVWEWHMWDHLIQDYDPSKANYGVVADHPELIDINYGGVILADWMHTNTVDYNEALDQILLCVLHFNEIWVIDHSTTTEEAAGHSGGRYGRGGDLLYRWGNPRAYHAGTEDDRMLYNQHDAHWIPADVPGGGNILIFNNGRGRPSGEYSSVEEIQPPVDGAGNYTYSPGSAYGPEEVEWRYCSENLYDFYAINLASAQRLANGNTLICNGPHGSFFEVTSEKEMVWKYLNQVPGIIDNHVFKIHRYSPDYPGLRFLV